MCYINLFSIIKIYTGYFTANNIALLAQDRLVKEQSTAASLASTLCIDDEPITDNAIAELIENTLHLSQLMKQKIDV